MKKIQSHLFTNKKDEIAISSATLSNMRRKTYVSSTFDNSKSKKENNIECGSFSDLNKISFSQISGISNFDAKVTKGKQLLRSDFPSTPQNGIKENYSNKKKINSNTLLLSVYEETLSLLRIVKNTSTEFMRDDYTKSA